MNKDYDDSDFFEDFDEFEEFDKGDADAMEKMIKQEQLNQNMIGSGKTDLFLKLSQIQAPDKPATKRKKRAHLSQEKIKAICIDFDQRNNSNNNPSFAKIAKAHEVSMSILFHLHKQWQLDPTLHHRLIAGRSHPFGNHKTAELNKQILALLKKNPFLASKEIAHTISSNKQLQGKIPPPINDQKIMRCLKQMGYTHRRINVVSAERNLPSNIDARALFCSKLSAALNKSRVIFLYEMPLNFYIKREFAWVKGNKFPKVPPNLQVSVMGMITRGRGAWEINCGGLDDQKLHHSLNNLLEDQMNVLVYSRYEENNDIHCPQIFAQKGLNLLEMPPFCQVLNPVHNWLRDVKIRVRKQDFSTLQEFVNKVISVVKQFDNSNMGKYFEELDFYIQRGINRQNF